MTKSASNTIFHFYDLNRQHVFAEYLFLFNSDRHLQSQSKNHWRVYELVNEYTQKTTARISFCIYEGKAMSPCRAPFGGLEIYDKATTHELTDFLRFIETDLKSHHVNSVFVRSAPEIYYKNSIQIAKVFSDLNYKHFKEVTSIIHVDSKSFERKIKVSERQKLRKSNTLFEFEKVSVKNLKEIYSFIAMCRKERAQTLSMTFTELSKTCDLFSNHFLLFKVSNREGNAAACIAIKVSDQILYTFYYGHARKFDKISPVVWMMSGIYDYAKEHRFKLIDLGTSIVNGKVSCSLLHFKRSIGGQNNDKLIVEKSLS